MTTETKLAMLLDELREAGATTRDVARLIRKSLPVSDGTRNTTSETASVFVQVLLERSVTDGFLDSTPWRDNA